MQAEKQKRVIKQTVEELQAALLTDLGEYARPHPQAVEKVIFPELEVTTLKIGK